MWIDSHCHLNHERLKPAGAVSDIIAAAKSAGVEGMLTINCRIHDELADILKIAEGHENVWCTIGTHPHEASNEYEKRIGLSDLVKLAQSNPKIVGIGESGLDYHYNFSTPEDQAESFRKHIRACLATDLPLVVHAREADEDIMRIIAEENPDRKLRGVMHSFSSGAKMAEEALEIGFYLSFSGMVTFKSADELRAIAKNTPLDRILVETDAPYLAPEPYRGKTNQPLYVTETGRKLAEIHAVSEESLAKHSRENFFLLFNKAELQ